MKEIDKKLFEAVKDNNPAGVQIAISTGADVNAKDEDEASPLHWASGYGYTEIAKLLIGAEADVNARDKEGGTPLHWAARGRPGLAYGTRH